jgi:type VI secretion system protein ImpH
MDLHRDVRGPERRALRDWLALFDHRAISLFYRAWEKYRFWTAYERGQAARRDPDAFTLALFSLIGLGERPLRRRLHVVARAAGEKPAEELARVEDLGLLFYAGLLAQRPRNAWNLTALVGHYFGLPVAVEQFRGRWLHLPLDARTALGGPKTLGVDTLAGRKVWDVRSRFLLRLGPMGLARFEEFLPDRSPVPPRKALFLLSQLVRLFLGPGLQFDVQLVLKAAEVPRLSLARGGLGARLGWNTWLLGRPATADRADAVFPSVEVTDVG